MKVFILVGGTDTSEGIIGVYRNLTKAMGSKTDWIELKPTGTSKMIALRNTLPEDDSQNDYEYIAVHTIQE